MGTSRNNARQNTNHSKRFHSTFSFQASNEIVNILSMQYFKHLAIKRHSTSQKMSKLGKKITSIL